MSFATQLLWCSVQTTVHPNPAWQLRQFKIQLKPSPCSLDPWRLGDPASSEAAFSSHHPFLLAINTCHQQWFISGFKLKRPQRSRLGKENTKKNTGLTLHVHPLRPPLLFHSLAQSRKLPLRMDPPVCNPESVKTHFLPHMKSPPPLLMLTRFSDLVGLLSALGDDDFNIHLTILSSVRAAEKDRHLQGQSRKYGWELTPATGVNVPPAQELSFRNGKCSSCLIAVPLDTWALPSTHWSRTSHSLSWHTCC